MLIMVVSYGSTWAIQNRIKLIFNLLNSLCCMNKTIVQNGYLERGNIFSAISGTQNPKGLKNVVWRKRNEKKHQLCIQQRVFPDSHPVRDHPVTRGRVTVGGLRSGTCQRSTVSRAHSAVRNRRGRPRHAWGIFPSLLDFGFFFIYFFSICAARRERLTFV